MRRINVMFKVLIISSNLLNQQKIFNTAQLIPRMFLFNAAKFSSVSISPDGKTIAYLAANRLGFSNIYTKCLICKYAVPVTFENQRHITGYQWTGVSNILLYHQDNHGDENYHLYKVNISKPSPSNQVHAINNKPGVKAIIIGNNLRDNKVLIGLNNENPAYHNVYEFNLITNKLKLIFRNQRFPAKIVVDNRLKIRMVVKEEHDGSLHYYKLSDNANTSKLTSHQKNWEHYIRVLPEDRTLTIPITFTADDNHMYWQYGAGSDLGRLVVHRFGSPNHSEILYTAHRAQISGILFHPTERTVLAISEIYHKPEIYVTNKTVLEDMQYLINLRPSGAPIVENMSQDFKVWLVSFVSEDQPHEYFIYQRPEKKAEYLFSTRPELHGKPLNRMIGFDYLARDGLRIQAYISLPPQVIVLRGANMLNGDVRVKDRYVVAAAKLVPATASTPSSKSFFYYHNQHNRNEFDDRRKELAELKILPKHPQKLVVLVHGGPKDRDRLGFSAQNAWLTNRGYAVLQVNYRGSVGFGKNFTNAGNGEWGRKMHQDILDGIDYLVDAKVVDRKQVAIMGGSYGGYATLVGMTFTPDVFACGVDIVGPSNLITLLDTLPPYWKGFYNDLTWMLGSDKKTKEGRRYLKSRSPLYFADRVKNPLLIIHGSNDPRVKQAESDQFVAALKRNSIPVTYVVYPDEGHGMRKPQNMLAMAGFVEEFLHQCLHGDVEPFTIGQYNSSARIVEAINNDYYRP